MTDFETINREMADTLLKRFLNYVRIPTSSDESTAMEHTPSTSCQWDLLNLLKQELVDIGLQDVSLDNHGYLIARLPGNLPSGHRYVETIGFMAHVDTNEDAPGDNICPIVHDYNGGVIVLKDNLKLDPGEFPLLNKYKDQKIITTDGNTLLGADDKAGVAEIMSAVDWLLRHPDIKHGNIEIIFTPDEETGCGMNRFPVEKLASRFCFTMDGGEEGELETECYHARKALAAFTGRLIHPGSARGKMVNAVSMAAAFAAMLPRNESPEATDGRYGNYWPHAIEGNLENAELTILYRDFSIEGIQRRTKALESFAKAVEAIFPGGRVSLETTEQYRNMGEEISRHPQLVEALRRAYALSGVEPIEKPIRGGTDGSKLTAKGIPTPNIFAGGQNFHSRQEWVALPAMTRALTVILNLVQVWGQ